MSKLMKIVALAAILFLWNSQLLLPQQEEPLTEYVEVTNVELIVRAMLDGKPVGGLKKSDFTLLENGEQLEITSFTEVRRKIGEKNAEPAAEQTVQEESKQQKKKERLFLMYFWISERELKYREALDYFFEKVYSEGDTTLLVVKNKVFQVTKRDQIAPALEWLQKLIRKAAVDIRSDTLKALRIVEELFKDYLRELSKRNPDRDILRLLRIQLRGNLEGFFQEFRYKHLVSNSKLLQALAAELKKLDHEKWGLVFFQENAFPQFSLQKMEYKLNKQGLEDEMSQMKKFITFFKLKTKLPNFSFFDIKKIKQAFVNGDTTFHVLWMNRKSNFAMETENFEIGDIYSGWMEAFKGISKVTGGEVMNANKLKESLEKIVEREDIYYRITYAPTEMKKAKRKIDVRIKRDGVKVYHLERVVVPAPKTASGGHAAHAPSSNLR